MPPPPSGWKGFSLLRPLKAALENEAPSPSCRGQFPPPSVSSETPFFASEKGERKNPALVPLKTFLLCLAPGRRDILLRKN